MRGGAIPIRFVRDLLKRLRRGDDVAKIVEEISDNYRDFLSIEDKNTLNSLDGKTIPQVKRILNALFNRMILEANVDPEATEGEGEDYYGSAIPPEKMFFKTAKESYSATPQTELDGFKLVVSTPTLKAYLKDKTLLIGLRGTKVTDKQDLVADAKLPFNLLKGTDRYKKDKATFEEIVRRYPPQDYEYYISGHSLGGAIDNQLKYDFPFVRNAVEYNPAFQAKDLIWSRGKDIKRLYTDKDGLYNLGGKLFPNNVVIPAKSSVGHSVVDAVSGHILSNFADLYNVSGGAVIRNASDYIKSVGIFPSNFRGGSKKSGYVRKFKSKKRHPFGKIWGSYKDGSDIFKDKQGYYIIRYLKSKHKEVKKHFKILNKYVSKVSGSGKNAGFIKMLYAKRVLKRKPEDYPTRDKKAPKRFLIKKIKNPSKHLQDKFETKQEVQLQTLNRPFTAEERRALNPADKKELNKLEQIRKWKSKAKKEGLTLQEYIKAHPRLKIGDIDISKL